MTFPRIHPQIHSQCRPSRAVACSSLTPPPTSSFFSGSCPQLLTCSELLNFVTFAGLPDSAVPMRARAIRSLLDSGADSRANQQSTWD